MTTISQFFEGCEETQSPSAQRSAEVMASQKTFCGHVLFRPATTTSSVQNKLDRDLNPADTVADVFADDLLTLFDTRCEGNCKLTRIPRMRIRSCH